MCLKGSIPLADAFPTRGDSPPVVGLDNRVGMKNGEYGEWRIEDGSRKLKLKEKEVSIKRHET